MSDVRLLVLIGVAVLVMAAICTVVLVFAMRNVERRITILTEEVINLRLTSRARVSQASMQSGPVSREQELVRLGRESVGKRRVVGGDDESEQHRMLSRGGPEDDDSGNRAG